MHTKINGRPCLHAKCLLRSHRLLTYTIQFYEKQRSGLVAGRGAIDALTLGNSNGEIPRGPHAAGALGCRSGVDISCHDLLFGSCSPHLARHSGFLARGTQAHQAARSPSDLSLSLSLNSPYRSRPLTLSPCISMHLSLSRGARGCGVRPGCVCP